MDNQILCFGVLNNFRMNRKKNFKGHMVRMLSATVPIVFVMSFVRMCTTLQVAGYACQIDVSPEGRLVVRIMINWDNDVVLLWLMCCVFVFTLVM